MSPDPSSWGGNLSPDHREPDDELHNPDPKRDRKNDKGGTVFTTRGVANLGCLAFLFFGIGMLLCVLHGSISVNAADYYLSVPGILCSRTFSSTRKLRAVALTLAVSTQLDK